MDNEVEMVGREQYGRKGNEIVPSDELEEGLSIRPAVRKQNTVFGLALASLMLAAAVLVVGKVYLKPDMIDVSEGLHSPDSGMVGNDVLNDKINATIDQLNSGHQFDIEDWISSHGHPLAPRPGQDADKGIIPGHPYANKHPGAGSFDQQTWLSSKVTKEDGPMYEVVKRLSHDPSAFLEGLAYSNGQLYESTGLNRHSTIRKLDPKTGNVVETHPMGDEYFGEGLTIVGFSAFQLTYKHQVGFVYDITDLSKPPTTFSFSSTTNEGWGLTYDWTQKELIMSDGSNNLHFWDHNTLQEKRRVPVHRLDGTPAKNINELEFWHGRVLANIWYEDTIVVIDPATGTIEKEYDFSDLWPKKARHQHGADVLNGISRSEDPSLLYITGKNWDRMFLVRLKF